MTRMLHWICTRLDRVRGEEAVGEEEARSGAVSLRIADSVRRRPAVPVGPFVLEA